MIIMLLLLIIIIIYFFCLSDWIQLQEINNVFRAGIQDFHFSDWIQLQKINNVFGAGIQDFHSQNHQVHTHISKQNTQRHISRKCFHLGFFFYCCISVFNFDMIILVLPYFILLCHLWMLSLRSPFLTNKRYNRGGSEKKGR